ncbi:unnamed protein product [Staurois parvus]|uniref:Uncharacterized protein n=1 Tax=Staurois parvus TaxID=386267 RepID=A0ABN9HJY6_9NEOB|nr:unnamed protein product [Staurois parvus]
MSIGLPGREAQFITPENNLHCSRDQWQQALYRCIQRFTLHLRIVHCSMR